jgi:hypothetical protein
MNTKTFFKKGSSLIAALFILCLFFSSCSRQTALLHRSKTVLGTQQAVNIPSPQDNQTVNGPAAVAAPQETLASNAGTTDVESSTVTEEKSNASMSSHNYKAAKGSLLRFAMKAKANSVKNAIAKATYKTFEPSKVTATHVNKAEVNSSLKLAIVFALLAIVFSFFSGTAEIAAIFTVVFSILALVFLVIWLLSYL